ncbi:MAG TPA: hypothetical protein VNT57_01350 [Desulfobacteria bacterium]|nr:hypothetical protein [Desulfobacteria bacterium]
MKALNERAQEIITALGTGTFPTYSQLRVMLKAEGYCPEDVDKWFAAQAAELLQGETEERQNFLSRDVYLVLDQENHQPLAFWTEGKQRILPLDFSKTESWQAANALRCTLRSEGLIREHS